MKISNYQKELGNNTNLILDYDDINNYDQIFLSKVFTKTKVPIDLNNTNIKYGGTGFYYDLAPPLPDKIEHCRPDYYLYDKYVESEINRGLKENYFDVYLNHSIGFSTRGCIRQCSFCVNKNIKKIIIHSSIKEFIDYSRKYICLLDDNILAFSNWHNIFDELAETKKKFIFKQGLDIRCLNEEKAKILANSKYYGHYIYAFDNYNDRELIINKLKLWRNITNRETMFYILCAYETQDINDIIGLFERIKIISEYGCLPYVMRYEKYEYSEFRGMYINITRWCNQPNIFKNMSLREFARRDGIKFDKEIASQKYIREFEEKYPEVAKKYLDFEYRKLNKM